MYFYMAYGLGINSEFLLPELVEANAGTDVIISREKIDVLPPDGENSENSFWASGEDAYRHIAKIGTIVVKRGHEIVVDIAPEVDEQLIHPYILGGALGTLLHQRGLLALHGSAISIDGYAVAFLGRSGSGKSTMAAALSGKYPLIADDIVAVQANEDCRLVFPAFPQIKLLPDSANYLGFDLSALPRFSPDEDKRVARMERSFSSQPLPLGRIYILEEGKSKGIQIMSPQDAMMALVNNTYTVRSLKAGMKITSHFLLCAKVAKHVPVRRLIRSLDLKALPDVIRMIEEDLKYDRRTRPD